MRLLPFLAALLLSVCQFQADAKAVFAHFMVSNTAAFSQADWATEINKAKTAGIDAFALNMAYGEATTQSQLPLAFAAANAAGFKLFFSIDYAGNGLWPKADVLSLLKRWIPDGAYYQNGAKPMVSTFEGTAAAKDWTDIKAQTGCYFIPDWSSLGAKDALQIAPGVPDGLFNWAGWPVGDRKMNNFVDASYALFLGAPEASVPNYMMPVSPWFYTNMPGFNKNWMWKGDNLWYDRWMEVLVTQPEFVQIVSWNDFGESHYVGTLRQSPPFADGKAAFDYVSGMPHEGWLSTLPYWTSMYKTGTASITKESITTWYLKHHPSSCDNGGTTVNTASHLQAESWPGSDVGNTLYVDAVLASPADVQVEVGSEILAFKWTNVPDGNVGVYHGSVNLNGRTGFVSVGLWRGTGLLGSITGVPIGGCDPSGKANFNPWVGSQTTGNVPATSPPHKVSDMKCVEGFSVGNFNSICQFACKNGYCPRGACVCTKLGPPPKTPDPVFQRGYSKNGDPNFGGLCDFSCNLGYCPSDVCSKTPTPEVIPKSSPFTPDTCTSGSANRMAGQGISVDVLCQEACFYGYCPIKACNCNSLGVLNDHPAADISIVGYPARTLGGDTVVRDICTFLCQIGKCPKGLCDSYNVKDLVTGPQCADDPNAWPCLTCANHNSWASPGLFPHEKWELAKATDAVKGIPKYLSDNKGKFGASNGYWSGQVGIYFGWNQAWDCGLTSDYGGCNSQIPCQKENTISLAGVLVLDSLAQMNEFFAAWYNAYNVAWGKVALGVGPFKETFAPDPKATLAEKFIDFIVNTCIDYAGGLAFKGISENLLIKNLTDETKEKLEETWGAASEMVGEKLKEEYEAMKPPREVPKVEDLEKHLGEFLNASQWSLGNYSEWIWNGTEEAEAQVLTLIADGHWLNASRLSSVPSVDHAVLNMAWGNLVQWSWSENPDIAPVIIMSDVNDDTSNPFAAIAGGADAQSTQLTDEEARSVRFGWRGKTFWLVSIKKCRGWADDGAGNSYCLDTRFTILPGYNKLHGGNSEYANIEVTNFIKSSYGGYVLNDNQNGYDINENPNGNKELPEGGLSRWAYEFGLASPGLSTIPICNYQKATFNWGVVFGDYLNQGGERYCDTFPCCSCEELGSSRSCSWD